MEHWHAWIGDPPIADTILDRLLAREHRITLKGDPVRPQKTRLTRNGGPDTERQSENLCYNPRNPPQPTPPVTIPKTAVTITEMRS